MIAARKVRGFENAVEGFVGHIVRHAHKNPDAVIETAEDIRAAVRRFVGENLEPAAAHAHSDGDENDYGF
jgi:hypothetical protein